MAKVQKQELYLEAVVSSFSRRLAIRVSGACIFNT